LRVGFLPANCNNNNSAPGSSSAVGGAVASLEEALAAKSKACPLDLCFAVPFAHVGQLIGKGGQTLRELQGMFGVRVYVEKEQYEGHRIVVLHYLLALEKPYPSVEVAPPPSMRPSDPISSGSVGGAPAAVGARPSILVGNKSAEDRSESEQQQQQVGQASVGGTSSSSSMTRAKGTGGGKGGCGKRKRGTKADQSSSEESGGGIVADGDAAGGSAGDWGGENEEEEGEGEEDEVCEAAVSAVVALPSSGKASANSSSVPGSSKGPVVVSVSEGPAAGDTKSPAGVVANNDQVGTSLDLASASSDDDALAALNRCKNYILTVVLKTDD
jgi:hypothetical protein